MFELCRHGSYSARDVELLEIRGVVLIWVQPARHSREHYQNPRNAMRSKRLPEQCVPEAKALGEREREDREKRKWKAIQYSNKVPLLAAH